MSKIDLLNKLRTGSINCIVASFLALALIFNTALPAAAAMNAGDIKLSLDEEIEEEIDYAIALEYNGVAGIWFPLQLAISLQQDIEEGIIIKEQVRLLEKQLTIKAERITLLEQLAATNQEALDVAKKSIETSIRLRREAEEDRDSFFAGKPWFWLAIGLAAGVLATVSLTLYLEKD